MELINFTSEVKGQVLCAQLPTSVVERTGNHGFPVWSPDLLCPMAVESAFSGSHRDLDSSLALPLISQVTSGKELTDSEPQVPHLWTSSCIAGLRSGLAETVYTDHEHRRGPHWLLNPGSSVKGENGAASQAPESPVNPQGTLPYLHVVLLCSEGLKPQGPGPSWSPTT